MFTWKKCYSFPVSLNIFPEDCIIMSWIYYEALYYEALYLGRHEQMSTQVGEILSFTGVVYSCTGEDKRHKEASPYTPNPRQHEWPLTNTGKIDVHTPPLLVNHSVCLAG